MIYNFKRSQMLFIQQLPSLFEYHKNTKNLNLQAITIWITRQKFIIVPNINRSRIPTILEIDRLSNSIFEYQQMNEERYNGGKPHYFSCLIGILDIHGKKVLLLAEEVCIVGTIGQRDVFRVVKPIYLFYNPLDKKAMTQPEAQILLNTTAIFQQGMYFSFTYDLALRMNSQPGVTTEIKEFNWAGHIQRDLQQYDKMWRVSIIQGYVGRLELHINGVKMNLILISRRAVKRGGTQSYARGVDREGNAGNYVQTEQIIITRDHYFSFVQVRGSVPLFWGQSQTTYGFTNINFNGSIEQNNSILKTHLRKIKNRANYHTIFLLNLLASSKQQKKLVQNYEYVLRRFFAEEQQKAISCDVYYSYFDVHANCPNKEYMHLNQFLEKHLTECVTHCGFTALKVDRSAKKMEHIASQTGVFRINCYNCIDRTNIAQSRIAALKLIEILKYLDIEINEFKNGLSFLAQNTPFSNLYRNLWADNGDALSKQYTGTGSTESFAVRKGKLSYLTILDHGMKSILRVIRNIRNQDENKQEAIFFILGQTIQDETMKTDRHSMEDKLTNGDYYQYQRLKEDGSRNLSFA